MTTEDRLQQIREREAKATPGEWGWRGPKNELAVPGVEWAILGADGNCCLQVEEEDAAFIANARQDIPFLLRLLADERERCAKVADAEALRLGEDGFPQEASVAAAIAAEIRGGAGCPRT